MPISECNTCGGQIQWYWEEAFSKFGFMDGDGQVETENVAEGLRHAGYDVTVTEWGVHNTVISSIVQNGVELISDDIEFGYDNPRDYLPKAIIELLDDSFPSDGSYDM